MKLQVRRGEMLFRRLGAVNAVKQKGRGREPARHGVWAFPWPVMDLFFAAHKFNLVLPKRLREDIGAFGPGLVLPTDEQRPQTQEEWETWHTDREQWLRRNRHVLRIRDFWWGGTVYTHLDRAGNHLGYCEWMAMTPNELAKAIRKHLASPIPGNYLLYRHRDGELERYRISADPLEVFIPMRTGRRG